MLIPKYWAQYKQRFEHVESIAPKLAATDMSLHPQTHPNYSSKSQKRQATIKRYGWSNLSQADALNYAKQRVAEAHSRWLAGEDIVRRERKEPYNESNGIPIREQIILERRFPKFNQYANNVEISPATSDDIVADELATTQLIVTRNSYGAQVANVNNIAIIDVDNIDLLRLYYPDTYANTTDSFFDGSMALWPPIDEPNKADPKAVKPQLHSSPAGITQSWVGNNQSTTASSSMKPMIWLFVIVSIVLAGIIAWYDLSWGWLIAFMVGMTALLWQRARKIEQAKNHAKQQQLHAHLSELPGLIRQRVNERLASHAHEQFRLYQTPAGFRIIAIHSNVLPSDTVVKEWFNHFHADSNYARLCEVQHCFRARLTPKPWRMGEVMAQHNLDKTIPTKDFWSQGSDDRKQRQAELEARKQWIIEYDNFAQHYRSCRFLEEVNSGITATGTTANKNAQAVIAEFVRWHDKACQVDLDLPMG